MNNEINIDISELLKSDMGTVQQEHIHTLLDSPDPEIDLISPIDGNVMLINLSKKILAQFDLKTKIKADCSRCAQDYKKEFKLKFEREYAEKPENEEMYMIKPNKNIDIKPAIIEEIIINIPIKRLCSPNCKGIRP